MSYRALVLFAESLDIRFAVGIEEFFAALLPRRSEFRQRDVLLQEHLPLPRFTPAKVGGSPHVNSTLNPSFLV